MNKKGMGIRTLLQLGCLPALLWGQQAHAALENVEFAGFASLVYAKTITDDDKEGVFSEISNDGEYRDFNKLGLRMHTDLKQDLSFTAQLVAEGKNDYDPVFDWIFLTYSLTPELSLSVGRYRVPVFMYSDYLDTSYAYQWIVPPYTVYNAAQTPFKSMEGLKLSYVTSLGGDWSSELMLWGGNAEDDFTESGVDSQLILEDAMGIAWTVERDWLSLRAFYMEADTSLDVTTNPIVADLLYGSGAALGGTSSTLGDPNNYSITNMEVMLSSALGGANVNFHDDLLWKKDPGKFYGVGAGLDFEHWFARTEITRIEADTNIVVPSLHSYYVMAGVRLPAKVTLSLTYGEDKDRTTRQVYQQFDPYIGLSPALDAMLVPYKGGIKQFADVVQSYDINITTLTARWDFHRSAALKFEYLIHEWENPVGKGDPKAVRIGLDLVF